MIFSIKSTLRKVKKKEENEDKNKNNSINGIIELSRSVETLLGSFLFHLTQFFILS